jgi:hypothetical protein
VPTIGVEVAELQNDPRVAGSGFAVRDLLQTMLAGAK